tara:strand:- start:63 stop:479 length:417 start_codon:yes stop_codon:yes gene_type:complete
MNSKIYEYGIDPNNGLPRRLVRDTALVQEEMDSNPKPRAVIHLREQTYIKETGVVVTDKTAGYSVIKGEISLNVDGEVLPKYIVNPVTGESTLDIDPETGDPYPRNNGYDNVVTLSKCPIAFDSVLDSGIKEYYKITD